MATTFRIGPPPPAQEFRRPSQGFQTRNSEEAPFPPAILPVQPIQPANAQSAFQPLLQGPVQPALPPITQVLQQVTAQPTSRPVTPTSRPITPTTPTVVLPVTPILQESSSQTVLRPVTPALEEATAQANLQPVSGPLQPIPQILQPLPFEKPIEAIPISQQVLSPEANPIEIVDMAEQMYQIQGANGPMIVTASQLALLQQQQQLQPQQYVIQQPAQTQQPQVQYIVQQPDSRPNSVYYTTGNQGQIVTPQVITTAGTPQAVTTTATGVPVVTQPQKDDDLLSFYDPTWYKRQSSCGSLSGTTLAWLVFACLLLIFILHVIAFGAPYWIWYTQNQLNYANLGLFQVCETLTGCSTPVNKVPTGVYSYFKASRTLAGLVLAGIVIMLIIFFVFLAKTKYTKQVEILFMVVTAITGILLLTLIALFDAQVRRNFVTSTVGGSYVLEIITLVFIIIIEIVAIVDYSLVTSKL